MSEARRVAAPSRPARVVTGSLLAAIVLLAAGLRLHRLDQLPPGLFIDQAQYGLDAYRIFQGETLPVFVEGPGGLKERGREPLFMYLMAGVFAIVGPSPFAIKLTSALIGIAAVPVLYLAASRWLGTRVGLLAAAILAVSRWHITFSRMGFRAILVPLWIGLVAFALAELVRRRSLAAAVAFGLVLGAGFYTYPAYWSVPLALLLVLAVALWERRPRRHAAREAAGDRVPFPGSEADAADVERGASVARSSLRPLIVAATVACLVVLAPLLAYASTRGEDLLARSSEVALFARGGGNSDAVETSILDGAQRVLFMLHLRGDSEPRHNLPGKPMLDPLTGLAFLGGLVALAKAPLPRATKTGVLAFWLLPLLPSAVTLAAPSGLRAVGTLPAVCAIAALGLDFAARAVERRGGRRARIAAVALVVALLGVGAVANARAYFVDWAEHPQIPVSYSADIPRFVEYLESLAVEADVVVCPYVHDSPNVRFLTLRQDPPFIPLHDVEALLAGDSARDRVFVCDDAAVNALIRRLYPEAVEIGRYAIYTIRTGRIHRVPRRALFRSLPAAEETQARHFILRMRESFAERSKAW